MVYRVSLGTNPRLERALESLALPRLSPEDDFTGKRLLFTLAVDEAGADPSLFTLLRRLRTEPGALEGAAAAMVADGSGELYTKSSAQALALACSRGAMVFAFWAAIHSFRPACPGMRVFSISSSAFCVACACVVFAFHSCPMSESTGLFCTCSSAGFCPYFSK